MRTMRAFFVIWLVVASAQSLGLARTSSMADRVEAQRAIESVFWKHRLWPAENAGTKPALSTVMPDAALRVRVEEYLDRSRVLSARGRAITTSMLQAEMDRMAARTQDPKVLAELFEALGRDPESSPRRSRDSSLSRG